MLPAPPIGQPSDRSIGAQSRFRSEKAAGAAADPSRDASSFLCSPMRREATRRCSARRGRRRPGRPSAAARRARAAVAACAATASSGRPSFEGAPPASSGRPGRVPRFERGDAAGDSLSEMSASKGETTNLISGSLSKIPISQSPRSGRGCRLYLCAPQAEQESSLSKLQGCGSRRTERRGNFVQVHVHVHVQHSLVWLNADLL